MIKISETMDISDTYKKVCSDISFFIGVVATEKGAFEFPSAKVANFTHCQRRVGGGIMFWSSGFIQRSRIFFLNGSVHHEQLMSSENSSSGLIFKI